MRGRSSRLRGCWAARHRQNCSASVAIIGPDLAEGAPVHDAASGDRYADEARWQETAGYARAARRGRRIAVSGTTSSGPDGGVLHPGDTYRQTVEALGTGLRAVEALGGTAADVLRTRIYLVPGASWEDAARAHREAFGAVRPANTMLYVSALIGDGLLVEVELDAELGAGS
jgi:enamine deaminase RidA (YjgF/YER057c/UK114 family)